MREKFQFFEGRPGQALDMHFLRWPPRVPQTEPEKAELLPGGSGSTGIPPHAKETRAAPNLTASKTGAVKKEERMEGSVEIPSEAKEEDCCGDAKSSNERKARRTEFPKNRSEQHMYAVQKQKKINIVRTCSVFINRETERMDNSRR